MKKRSVKLKKMETIYVMLIMLIFLVVVQAISQVIILNMNQNGVYDKLINILNVAVITLYSSVAIPMVYYMLQLSLIKKMENKDCNIDVVLKEKADEGIIWRVRTNSLTKNKTFLVFRNTGKLVMYELHIEVKTHDGLVGRYYVVEKLTPDNEHVVQVPFERGDIKEIITTYDLQIDNRTKVFNGTQSGNDDGYILSNIEIRDAEKNAIYHDIGFEAFEKLERFVE